MKSVTFTSGRVELDIVPDVGGRIHALRVDGQDVFLTPPDVSFHETEPLLWGSYPLVPWCNRIPGGELWFEGAVFPQPLNLDPFAVHGRALSAPWNQRSEGTFEFIDRGDSAYPWPYRALQEYSLVEAGFVVQLSIENVGTGGMPAGVGIHPWFDAAGGLEVSVPADLVYPSSGNIPTGPPEAVSGTRDLRTSQEPAAGIDECWTGLFGRTIELRRAADRKTIRFTYSDEVDHVVLAAVPTLGGVAIEPQTHAVDGHGRRERGEEGGISILEPGEVLTVEYRVELFDDES